MKSIRGFLLLVILAVLTLFNFVAALKGYQSSMAEADRLFDKQLLDTAKLIANIHTSGQTVTAAHNSTFAFQVWRQEQLLASSSNAPKKKIVALEPGFNYSNFAGYRWRTLVYFDTHNQYWVAAAERTDIRYTLAENVVFESILPVLTGIPLVGILIWLIIGQGLKPLRQLANDLAGKQATDLSPLPLESSTRELQQIVRSSNLLLSRLEGALQRESQFAADAAHELRTPISAIKIQLHNLVGQQPDSQLPAQLVATTERLEHIVEQILDLYRSSPDQYNAHLKPLDLNPLIEEVLAEAYPQFEAKQQTLEFQPQTPTDTLILADRFAMATLLRNLFSNANKYTPAGGKILVSTCYREQKLVLRVDDSGVGIPVDLYATVFERFYRVGGDRHQSGQSGCGLGLAIVKHIVQSHNASIEVRHSCFTSGTAFILSFR